MSMKYAVILEMIDKMTAPLKSMTSGVRSLSSELTAVQNKAGGMARINSALHTTQQKLGSVLAVAGKLGAVSGLGVGGLAMNATNISAKYEDLGAVLETLEGSSEKAQTSLAWIKDFTKTTPYELANTAEAFSRLRAYGIDPMDGTMRMLGDTSAAMGKDIMAAVEMMADAVVGSNERLKEFGIRASTSGDEITYNYKNKAGEQETKTVNKNDQNAIKETLQSIFNEKYTGAMEKRSKTFNGILSNMKDTFAGLQSQFMSGGLFESMKAGLQSRLDFMTRLMDSGDVEKWGQSFAGGVNFALDAVGKLNSGVVAVVTRVAELVGGWQVLAGIMAGFGGWWLLGDLFVALASSIGIFHIAAMGLAAVLSRWRELLPAVTRFFPAIGTWLESRLPGAVERFKTAFEVLKQIWGGNEYWGGDRLQQFRNIFAIAFNVDPIAKFKSTLGLLKSAWSQVLVQVLPYLPRLQAAVSSAFGAIGGWLKQTASLFSQALAGVAVGAIETLSVWLEKLAAFASGGGLSRWISSVAVAVTEFASGLLAGIRAITIFTVGFVEFIGGWKVFAGIFAGGYVIAMLSGFLQGLGALVGLIGALLTPLGAVVALFAAVAIAVRYLIVNWDEMSVAGRAIGVLLAGIGTAILGYVAYLKLSAMWTAFQLTPLGAWVAGLSLASVWAGITAAATWVMTAATSAFTAVLAVLTSPITLVIAAIAALAAGAYYLYSNWGQVTAYLSQTTWGQMLLAAINMVLSPVQTFNAAVAYLQGLWSSTKASLAETTWGQMLLAGINMLLAPFDMFKAVIAALTGGWSAAKASLADTSWGQAILAVINSVMAGFEKLKAGFAAAKSMASAGVSMASEKISGAVSWAKSAVGMESSGNRALGGAVEAGKMYRVNEYGDELIERGNKMFLMSSGAGKVIPFPNMPNMRQETPFAAPAGVQTVPQRAAAMAANAPSRSEVDVRIISDKPVQVERMRSDRNTALTVDTGRMMTSP